MLRRYGYMERLSEKLTKRICVSGKGDKKGKPNLRRKDGVEKSLNTEVSVSCA